MAGIAQALIASVGSAGGVGNIVASNDAVYGGSAAGIRFNSDGTTSVRVGGSTWYVDSAWISPKSGMSAFDVKCTRTGSAVVGSNSTGTWLNLGTSQSWSVTATSGNYASANLTLTFRNATTLAFVKTISVSLEADMSGTGGGGGGGEIQV